MCGIAGVVARDGTLDSATQRRHVRAMLGAMSHRGPDDETIETDQDRVVLGFRRLSIIDLDGGQQPIRSEDGSVVAIANGEIYNHRELRDRLAGQHALRSGSDCEVLPHLYEEHGLGFVDHLNGMYAIALWDRDRQTLVLVRDRLGVKPLYYYVTDRELIFASELKGLFAHPAVPIELDWSHAVEFLHRRWVGHPGQRPTSWFKGVQYLPAAHVLTVGRDGAITDVPYWSLPREVDAGKSIAQWVEGYRALLDDSVRLQLAADVEVGLFLSGGIDSVSIAQLARHHGSFHTFSIASAGTYETGDLTAAAEVAKLLGVEHHEALMDDGFELSVDTWSDLLRIVEQPICTIEQLYKFRLHRFAKTERPALKVILLGQGSDEFNGGYGSFWLARNAPANAPRDWPTFIESVRRSQLRSLATYGNPSMLKIAEMFPAPVIRREYLASFGDQRYEDDEWLYYLDMQRHMLQRYNLWHEDRTAAANSIENRVPFLDHRIAEYTARIPREHRAELLWDKAILRRSFAAELPQRFAARPKVPFVTMSKSVSAIGPIWDLLRANDFAIVDVALDRSPEAARIFDRDALRTSLRTCERSEIDWLMMLVSMCLMETTMRDQRPVQPSSIPAPPVLETADRDAYIARWNP